MNSKIGEFELIRQLLEERPGYDPDVLVDAGDDAALVRCRDGVGMLFTCDAQVCGIHFHSDTAPDAIGRRLAAVNLSDIAAMGGQPRWALFSAMLPAHVDPSYLTLVNRGLLSALAVFDTRVIGGNISAVEGPLALELFLVGEVSPQHVMTRRGAAKGELLCITGTAGDSAAGLLLLQRGDVVVPEPARSCLVERHLNPSPRLVEGQILSRSGNVSACIDVSDGLWQDAGHLARASQVALRIDASRIPLSASVCEVADPLGVNPRMLALRGGEDYELLFTVKEQNASDLIAELASRTGVSATIIGEVVDGDAGAVRVVDADGCPLDAVERGFDHLLVNRSSRDGGRA